jgi:putative endonuclease
MHEHKNGLLNGFTQRYHVDKLVYIERYDNPTAAIMREKNIKGWKREKKIELIEKSNPSWEELTTW